MGMRTKQKEDDDESNDDSNKLMRLNAAHKLLLLGVNVCGARDNGRLPAADCQAESLSC